MQVTINGEHKTLDAHVTLAELLAELQLQPRYVAVERNEELVPRARHADCELMPGDRLEIVTLVGGG